MSLCSSSFWNVDCSLADVDECTRSQPPPCGNPPQHGLCTNTPGSYYCSCEKGYEGTGYNGDCQQIKYCADSELNDCDPDFATCTLNEGSYKCKCKFGLEGDGTKGFCKAAEDSTWNVYCESLGFSCHEYQECKNVGGTSKPYKCVAKSRADQIATFLESGPSSNTPEWVWAVVIIGTLLLFGGGGFVAFWAYRRVNQQRIDAIGEDALNAQQDDYGTAGSPA